MKDRLAERARVKRILIAVVDRYNSVAETNYRITRWPDEEERNDPACDAYAESSGHIPLAIEHRTLPTFEPKQKHDDQFMKAVGGLDAELKHAFPYHLSLVVPMFAVKKGQKWSEIKDAIKAWLLANSNTIRIGRSKVSIPGVSFEISLDRDDELSPLFVVSRWLDEALDVPQKLAESIALALGKKDAQLSRYKKDGDQTLLVLESQDIALVNPAMIYKAFLNAMEQAQPKYIDQVWLANTYEPERSMFISVLLADQSLMDRVNPENFMWGPQYYEYWSQVMKNENLHS